MSLRQHLEGDCWPDLCPWCAYEDAQGCEIGMPRATDDEEETDHDE